jgi:hypothetical protein
VRGCLYSPRTAVTAAITLLLGALFASPAACQTDKQIWGELNLDWIKSHTLTLGADVEPKVLVSKQPDEPGWATLELTPRAEYTRGQWFDIVGELHAARTRQTDEQDSTEVTPRIGFRFHVLSNLVSDLAQERQPRRRLVLRNFARVEWRNIYYSDGTPRSSTVRYRDRIEMLFPVNRQRVTDNGAWYKSADAEWFWTHQDPPERFANKQRVRAGVGYRWNYAWRLETLYVWDRSRDSAQDGFTTDDTAVNVRVRHAWEGSSCPLGLAIPKSRATALPGDRSTRSSPNTTQNARFPG